MAIADRRSLRGGVLLAALTLCSPAPCSRRRRRACSKRCSAASAVRAGVPCRRPAHMPIRRPVRSQRPAGEAKRLRPRHGLLRAHLRRPLFPAAAPCRLDAGRAVQVVLPGRQDHGVLRQQDRHRRRAKRHALRRSRQRLRLSRQGERRLLLQRQGRARARAGRYSGDPTLRPGDIVATDDGLSTYTGKNKTAEFTPISTSSSEWARRLAEVRCGRRRRPRRSSRWPTTSRSRSARGRAQASRY